jgi:hypothetical protein
MENQKTMDTYVAMATLWQCVIATIAIVSWKKYLVNRQFSILAINFQGWRRSDYYYRVKFPLWQFSM